MKHKNPRLSEARMRSKYMHPRNKGDDRKRIVNVDNFEDIDEAFRNFFIRRGMNPPRVSSHTIEGMGIEKERTY